MAEEIIKPDLIFINDVINSGGESLKKCFQCATCSVVCNLTPDDKPFPRKEMLHAQWGLKDKLFSNPDIWLCYQCSDCTAYCPRGAKPGEVLGAIRKLSLQHYSSPKFLAKMAGDAKYLLLLFAVPVLIFLTYLGITGKLNNVPKDPVRGIVYSNLIPTTFFIDPVFIAAAVFAAIVFAKGIMRYWNDMSRNAGTKGGNIIGAAVSAITEILAHRRFNKCEVTKGRSISHILVFYSFAGLAITTTWAMIYLYGPIAMKFLGMEPFKWLLGESPYPLTDPLKILGNASAAGLALGILLVIFNRIKNSAKTGIGSYYDWLFIGVVFFLMATGILSEVFRLMDIAALAYPTYIAHLSFVFFLFAYAPFSKMAHMVYRATAMIFAKQAGRE
ncbi:MAG: quinone-interacting membrane-bound oxidoreductase complex subunit QmoC [Nitrospirae bacterium]|nr:quinone-interacting membrane-bound oxidoreductase complex subunit QmoC [Nitrospirota bacterium]